MRNKEALEIVRTDLEIKEHINVQRRGFVLQKIGTMLILLIIVFAAIGMFGDGTLSKGELTGKAATASFERFYRHEAIMKLSFNVNAMSNCVVKFPADYIGHFEIESIMPTPERSVIAGDQVIYTFSGKGRTNIIFQLIPHKIGTVTGDIEVGADHFSIHHFIFP